MEEFEQDADWKHWFREHGPKLLLCARQWTKRSSDADDIVQEAFVRFWKRQRHLAAEAGSASLPLLLVSIRRAALDLARQAASRTRREDASVGDLDAQDGAWFETADGGDSEERARAITAALQELPVEQREVVVLKIWGEFTFEAIAHQLGIPLNTAASRYRYGLAAMRRILLPAKPSSP